MECLLSITSAKVLKKKLIIISQKTSKNICYRKHVDIINIFCNLLDIYFLEIKLNWKVAKNLPYVQMWKLGWPQFISLKELEDYIKIKWHLVCKTKIDFISTWYTVSEGKVFFFDLVLTERDMQVEFDLKLSVYSLGADIWLLFFKFNLGLMGWPPQPPRERVPKSIE